MSQPIDFLDFLTYARDHIAPDVTVQRLLVLLHVARSEGLSQNELAQQLAGISTTALSRNLADLSAVTSRKTPGPALIEQHLDQANLRKKRIYLTDKGHRFMKRWARYLPDDL
ncbi:MAG: MarR family winged helix-turn-helix transcriptional regulator [Pseudomonadota bacterium]